MDGDVARYGARDQYMRANLSRPFANGRYIEYLRLHAILKQDFAYIYICLIGTRYAAIRLYMRYMRALIMWWFATRCICGLAPRLLK